jgi:hypothetical protein
MNFIKELRKIPEPGQILVKEKLSKRDRKKQRIKVKRLVLFNKQGTTNEEHIDHLPCVCFVFPVRDLRTASSFMKWSEVLQLIENARRVEAFCSRLYQCIFILGAVAQERPGASTNGTMVSFSWRSLAL